MGMMKHLSGESNTGWTEAEKRAQEAYEKRLAEILAVDTQEVKQNRCVKCNRLAKKGHELCKRCEAE